MSANAPDVDLVSSSHGPDGLVNEGPAASPKRPTMFQRQLLSALLFMCGAVAIMTPRLASPQFGLLDDGVTITVAERFARDPLFLADLEAARGRFRPASWLYYLAQYPLLGTAPFGSFVVPRLGRAAPTLLLF